jgi:hypothetical protein
VRILTAGLLALGLHDLWQNYRVWRIASAAGAFKTSIFDPQAWYVTNHADPAYTAAISAGAVLSLASLAFLLFMWRRSRRLPA